MTVDSENRIIKWPNGTERQVRCPSLSHRLLNKVGTTGQTSQFAKVGTMSTRNVTKQAEEIWEKVLERIVEMVYQKYKETIDGQNELIQKLKTEVKELSEENTAIRKKIKSLKSSTDRRIDELEQYGRRNNLRIRGIEETTGENVNKIIMDTAKKIGARIDESCIDRAHRVGRPGNDKPRPIIVKFTSYAHRREMWINKKSLRGSTTSMTEDLTRTRATLLYKVNNTYPKKSVWTSDGVILVKYKDQTLRLVTEEDLDAAYKSHPPLTDSE